MKFNSKNYSSEIFSEFRDFLSNHGFKPMLSHNAAKIFIEKKWGGNEFLLYGNMHFFRFDGTERKFRISLVWAKRAGENYICQAYVVASHVPEYKGFSKEDIVDNSQSCSYSDFRKNVITQGSKALEDYLDLLRIVPVSLLRSYHAVTCNFQYCH